MDEIDIFTWYAMKFVLLAGGLGLLSAFAFFGAACFYVSYLIGAMANRKEKPMGHAKLDHIKYDILPDGTLGPGDNRNLEGPE